MRNLKRVLSLALACVMVIGMMVMTTGAADIADIDEVKNVEAVEVMAALGVLEGDENGVFNPNGILTREQAAKIICFMLMGPENAKMLTGTSNFTDVAADRWSAPYISYCASLNIISGYDGKFDPTGELTGVAFAKMLLIALGYDAAIEGYVNNGDWATNIGTDAIDAGINIKGVDLGAAVSRENAAQMALNALEANLVKYTNKGTTITIDGVDVVVGASEAEARKLDATGGYDYTDGTNGAGNANETIQFCEKYFSALKQSADIVNGRNGYSWVYKNKPVSDEFVVTDTTLHTSTDGTTVTNLLTKGNKGYAGYKMDATAVAYLNGAMDITDTGTDTSVVATNAANDGMFIISDATDFTALKTWGDAHCGIGTEIELVDTNRNGKIDAIAITEYTASKITGTTKELANGTEATITVPGMNGGAATAESLIAGDFDNLNKMDVVIFADIATTAGVYSYSVVYEPDTFTGKMAKYNTTLHTMTIDGDTHKASAATVNGALAGFTQAQSFTGTAASTFYVDANGYVVAVDGINDIKYAVLDSIAYVNGSGVEGKGYAEARLVFTDGTTEIVTVSKIDGGNIIKVGDSLSAYDDTSGAGGTPLTTATAGLQSGYKISGDSTTEEKFYGVDTTALASNDIYTYSIQNGKYVLTSDASKAAGSATFVKGVPTIGTLGGVANDNTVYVVKTKVGMKDVWTTYTGYKNLPTINTGTINADYATTVPGGIVFCYINATAATNVGDPTYDVAFFFGNVYTVDNTDPTKPLYEYTAVLNGELQTVVATSNLGVGANTLYKVTLNDKGQVTATAAATGADFNAVTAYGDPAAKNGVLSVDDGSAGTITINGVTTNSLTYDGTETVYLLHTVSKTVTVGSVNDIPDNAPIQVKTVNKVTDAGKIAVSVAYVTIAD